MDSPVVSQQYAFYDISNKTPTIYKLTRDLAGFLHLRRAESVIAASKMLTRGVISGVKCCRLLALQQVKRNLAVASVCQQKSASDPIQQLFLDKIREYTKKSKAAGGALVDATKETTKSLQDELAKIDRQYGADKEDLTQFPVFTFSEPVLEAVGVDVDVKAAVQEEVLLEEVVEEDKPYWEA